MLIHSPSSRRKAGNERPWLREMDTIDISSVVGKQWVREAVTMSGKDDRLYLVCSSGHTQALLECRALKVPGAPSAWCAQRVGADSQSTPCGDQSSSETPLHMPMGAAAADGWLVVTDYSMHRAVVYREGKPVRVLTAETMRQPCAVATDGALVVVAGGSMLHVFELSSGACTRLWPIASPDGAFECEHGIALHNGSVLVVDRRGCRVHVFDLEGVHQRSWGEPGDAPGSFRKPWGIAVCHLGHVLVSEYSGRRVQIFTIEGHPVGQLYPEGCGDLAALSLDQQSGRVLVADWDQHCVRVLQVMPVSTA